MNDDNTLLAVVFAFGLFIGGFACCAITSDYWQQAIVDKGFAEWQIVTGSREVEFKWKEK